MSNLNTKNLYAELDRKAKEKSDSEQAEVTRAVKKNNAAQWFAEYGKVLLFFVIILGAFAVFHREGGISGNIQAVKDYFENFQNPNYFNRGKNPKNYNKDVVVEDSASSTLVPVIEISGALKRDGEDYVIFRYKNKAYTKCAGETFADGQYRVTSVSPQEIEVTDMEGRVFYYQFPNFRTVDK